MVETPSSSSSASSCASSGSFDDVSVKYNGAVKFVCSYGGKILPRYPDGKLRYFGGDTRVLAVDRSITFSDLMAKLGELSGWGSLSLRCQLPTEDLDALVSITSDEDLMNLIEEYDLANRERASPLKIRAFLHEISASKGSKSPSPPRISSSSAGSHRCVHHQISAPPSRLPRSARYQRAFNSHHHQHQKIPKNQHYIVNH